MGHGDWLTTRSFRLTGYTGPNILQEPPSRGQHRGEGNVLNAAQLQGLQSDALMFGSFLLNTNFQILSKIN